MTLAMLWGMPRDRGDKPKSGRIIKLGEAKKMTIRVDGNDVEIDRKPLTGWRKTAHEQKQKLFGPRTPIGTVLPKAPEKCAPVVPTKPVFHVTCANTGVAVVGGRLWPCSCGKPATFKYKLKQYATDKQIEERGSYV